MQGMLWFDVDFQQDTTITSIIKIALRLWFDVDFQQDTTLAWRSNDDRCCGLM